MAFLGEDVPKLGFGLMRLPRVDGKMENPIDIEQVKKMVDLYLESGFSYFDTAYVYGGSEEAAKAAIVDRYPREAFLLADKLPIPEKATPEECEERFNTSLERTGAGYFDCYLLHGIGSQKNLDQFDKADAWNFVKRNKEEGLIKHIGFSFHEHPQMLAKILDDHPEMEFVQLQINYADWDDPVVEARRNYEVALEHNVPIIIMEPLRGGKLANLPAEIEEIFKRHDPDAPISSWGLRFAARLDGVITVLSGMSTYEQLQQNIDILQNNHEFTDNDHQAISQAQQAISQLPHVHCTDCRYCLPKCPKHIPIPVILDAYNDYLTYRDLPGAMFSYGFGTMEGPKASDCIKCGACEAICTQHLNIIELLETVVDTFEKAPEPSGDAE